MVTKFWYGAILTKIAILRRGNNLFYLLGSKEKRNFRCKSQLVDLSAGAPGKLCLGFPTLHNRRAVDPDSGWQEPRVSEKRDRTWDVHHFRAAHALFLSEY